MKFDQKYPFGQNPPHSDYRRLIAYLKGHQFHCVKCGEPTSWVCVSSMTATCSEECLAKQVVQGSSAIIGHWLMAKNDRRPQA